MVCNCRVRWMAAYLPLRSDYMVCRRIDADFNPCVSCRGKVEVIQEQPQGIEENEDDDR